MVALSMSRSLELDVLCGKEVRVLFKNDLSLSNMSDELNDANLREIATRFEISYDELCSYVCWLAPIYNILRGCDDSDELELLGAFLVKQVILRGEELARMSIL